MQGMYAVIVEDKYVGRDLQFLEALKALQRAFESGHHAATITRQ